MKTHNKTLDFTKHTVIELNDQELFEIDGGTSVTCVVVFVASLNFSFQVSKEAFN